MIKSYVLDYYISTIHRQTSVIEENPKQYYETCIFKKIDNQLELLDTIDSGTKKGSALKNHFGICYNIAIKNGF